MENRARRPSERKSSYVRPVANGAKWKSRHNSRRARPVGYPAACSSQHNSGRVRPMENWVQCADRFDLKSAGSLEAHAKLKVFPRLLRRLTF